MIIAPIEIQKKEFHKSFRGYNEEEVKDFLDKITVSYEMIYKENQDLKEQVAALEEKLRRYSDLEDTLKKAVVLAEKTAEEVRTNAQKERDAIIKQAMVKANQIVQKTEARCNSMVNQYEELRRQFLIYKTRFINFLQSQLDLINNCELEAGDSIIEQFMEEAAATRDACETVEQEEKDISSINDESMDYEGSDTEDKDAEPLEDNTDDE